MGLISSIKSALGMGDADHESGDGPAGTSVTVEREPDATSERAVKKSDAAATGGAAASTDIESEAATGEESEPVEEDSETPEEGVPVEEVEGIGPAYGERLADAGVHTVSGLAAADAAELAAATGIGEGRIEGWIERAAEN